jgi:hypothetical protein
MTGGRTKKKVMEGVSSYVREHIKTEYSASELHDPADDGSTLATQATIREWAEAGRMASLQLTKRDTNLRKTYVEYLEAIQAQYRKVYSAAATSLLSGQQAIVAFTAWKADTGYDAWAYFTAQQGPGATKAKEVVAEQQRLKAISDNSNAASLTAIAETKNHAGGPDTVVGTVICGMADAQGNTYLGTSGHGALHAVMAKLLVGVQKVEKWPIDVCGEIDAMNQYLANNVWTEVAQIPKGELFSHAETWDATGRKWKGRSACYNCAQWLKKIEAHMA